MNQQVKKYGFCLMSAVLALGIGAAAQVISGQRTAYDVRTLGGWPFGQLRTPPVLQIELDALGVAL